MVAGTLYAIGFAEAVSDGGWCVLSLWPFAAQAAGGRVRRAYVSAAYCSDAVENLSPNNRRTDDPAGNFASICRARRAERPAPLPKLPVRAAALATETAPPAAAPSAATLKPSTTTTVISALRVTLITTGTVWAARDALRGIVHGGAFVRGRSAVAPVVVWLLVIPLAGGWAVDPLVKVGFARRYVVVLWRHPLLRLLETLLPLPMVPWLLLPAPRIWLRRMRCYARFPTTVPLLLSTTGRSRAATRRSNRLSLCQQVAEDI